MSSACQVASLNSSYMGTLSLPDEPRWYALRTRSRHEKMATHQLETRGIETWLPSVTRVHRWSDRKKRVEVPLFSGYTFVRVAYASNEQRLRVLQTHGVVGFVGVQRTGIPIPDSQIEHLRTLLANDIPLKEHSFLRIGQRVRVRGGALDGVEGILTAQNGQRSLVISLDPIERSLSIRVEGYDVEAV
ncbi:MAG TPA: UpxY family transcription antiterminator [Candidatus Sulfotelmatobacter sp.]|nr:UpxY family transcription antiterminator [Candidatus Sulfotelmatobacter sp.]